MPRPLGKPKEHGTAVQVGNEAPGGLVKPGDHTPILPIRYLGDPPARFFHKRGLMEKMSHPNRAKRSEGCNMLQLCLVTVLRLETCYIITLGGIQCGAVLMLKWQNGMTTHPEPQGPSHLGFKQVVNY